MYRYTTEEALGRTLAEVPTDVPGLIALAKEGNPTDGGDCAPWFGGYQAQLERTLAFAEHEAIDHPVVVVSLGSHSLPGSVRLISRTALSVFN